jgi:hypothetical protein
MKKIMLSSLILALMLLLSFPALATSPLPSSHAPIGSIPTSLDTTIANNSPELYGLIEMAGKIEVGLGYGQNGKFLAPIDPPEAGSIPISTRS